MKILYVAILALWGSLSSAKSDSPITGKYANLDAVAGSIVSLNVEFDMYKVREGSNRRPSYYYVIMPAPEPGIGGRFITYLGRMPSGTRLEVVSVNSRVKLGEVDYWLKLADSFDREIKGNVNRKIEPMAEPIEQQSFKLYSIASNVGLYEKGKRYSNGAPKLSETWFSLVKLNE